MTSSMTDSIVIRSGAYAASCTLADAQKASLRSVRFRLVSNSKTPAAIAVVA